MSLLLILLGLTKLHEFLLQLIDGGLESADGRVLAPNFGFKGGDLLVEL